MRTRLTLFLALAVACSLAAAAARLDVAPIAIQHRTLANGLEVYSVEDHSSPTVAIEVWYRVGSKNDPPHRSGFAHLFEHIMFKGTKHMKNEMMDRLTEDVGGENNASTRDDATQYYEVVPSNYLETLLWAEGERMSSLNVNEDNLKSERDVVKEEYRYRVLAPPYGLLFNALDRDSWVVHPYKRPGIGNIEDLDASTLADVRSFHDTWYRPDNAVLVVAGDFDRKQLDGWVDEYLGSIPRPSTPIPRLTVKEPPHKTTRRYDEHGPNVPLPGVALTWLIPNSRSADAAPLTVAAAILGLGDSSRAYQTMVYRKQMAQEVDIEADLREDAGLFIALSIMASGHSAAEGSRELRHEIAVLAEKSVGDAELSKAKNQLVAAILRDRETNEGKASAIGEAVVVDHDANEVNRGIDEIERVTPADVRRVVKKYLAAGKPAVINYTGASK